MLIAVIRGLSCKLSIIMMTMDFARHAKYGKSSAPIDQGGVLPPINHPLALLLAAVKLEKGKKSEERAPAKSGRDRWAPEGRKCFSSHRRFCCCRHVRRRSSTHEME